MSLLTLEWADGPKLQAVRAALDAGANVNEAGEDGRRDADKLAYE